MSRVTVEFDGVSRGAVSAARDTRLALNGVSTGAKTTARELQGVSNQAQQTTRHLHGTAGGAKNAEREVGRLSRGALAGSGIMKGFGRSVAFASAGFLGAAGFVQAVKLSIGAAFSLGREITKTRAVFGGSAREVLSWSRTTANALGVARVDALNSANQFGQLFKVMGVGPQRALELSKALAELSPKLSLFGGGTPEEAAAALSAAFTGRARGLRQYGIVIDNVTLKAEAMRLGLIKTEVVSQKVALAQDALAIATAKAAAAHAKYGANTTQAHTADDAVIRAHMALEKATAGVSAQMSQAARVQATYSLIQQQSAAATKVWNRENGGAEAQLARVKAEIKDTEVTIGRALLPEVLRITKGMADWLSQSKNQAAVQRDVHTAVKLLTGAIRLAVGAVRLVDSVTGSFKHTLILLVGAIGTYKAVKFGAAVVNDAKIAAAAITRLLVKLGLIGPAAATANAEVATQMTLMDAEVATTTTAVGGLRAALLSLGGGTVLGALGAAAAAVAGIVAVYTSASSAGGPTSVVTGPSGVDINNATKAQLRLFDAWLKKHPQKHMDTLGQAYNTSPAFRKYVDSILNPQGSTSFDRTPGRNRPLPASGKGGGFLPKGASYTEGRSDQGRDFQTDSGGAIIAPGNGYCIRVGSDPKGFGPDYPIIHMTSGHYSGQSLYIGHCHSALVAGQRFRTGQVIAHTGTRGVGNATVGGWAEIGFAPGGSPGPFGQQTPFGKGAATPSPPPPPPPPPGIPGLTVGRTPRAGPKGATRATLISVRAGIDAQLRAFDNLAPTIKAQLSPLAQIAEKHLEDLRAHLKKGMSATDLAQTRAGIARWGKVLRDEISKAKTAAEKVAKEAADAAALAFDRQFRDASTGVFRIFDRDTDNYVKTFQRDTDKAIAEMRKAFDKQMQAFDDETRRGLQAFVVPTTPAEQALADFQAARQAESDAKAMAAAQASGDPEQIRQLQLDLQERALSEAAKQSRDAQDTATQQAQDAYQRQRDDQRNALQEAESDREQAYQEQRDATLAVYQQLREDQRTHLQDDLDDWATWIQNKKKTWAEFLAWLSTRGFAVPSGWFQGIDDEVIQRNLFGTSAGDIGGVKTKGPGGHAPGFALGGRVPGMFVGREDTVLARLSPGETVIDRHLTRALERMTEGGGAGGPTIVLDNPTFIGAPTRGAAEAWARDMQDALDRLIGYRNPIT